MVYLALDSLPEPGDRYTIGELLGTGVWAKVYKAIDTQNNDRIVAIKIQPYRDELKYYIDEEYRVFRDYSSHPNLPNFYGVYRKKTDGDEPDDIWFILEYCEGGSVISFVNRLQALNKRISEEHIAYILRETAVALAELHKNHIIHRDVRGSNILLTAEGEVKLCDFGLSAGIGSTFGKRGTCVGSPCWMAPEMVTNSNEANRNDIYGSRADVWALGITAIEIGDGVAPFSDMHPTRALFQIVRNPPPTLYRPANWTQNFNDFIAECLEKNQDNRPFMVELLEHPFFVELIGSTGSDHHLSCEIKHLLGLVASATAPVKDEIAIDRGCIKRFETQREKMYVEDLAALEKVSEEVIVEELKQRLSRGDSYTFIGDVLLSLNSNELPLEFPRSFHNKYICKSRSESSPHIFSVADSAYQDMSHHEETQNILLGGESYSGKTTNLRLAIKHLTVLGEGNANVGERVLKAVEAVNSLINAGTPLNPDSTRCTLQTQITFGQSGKLSGVIFSVFLLEKLRVSSTDMDQSNFHIFYYFYDAINAKNELEKYTLDPDRAYRYLRVPEQKMQTKLPYYRDNPDGNVARFDEFESTLRELDFDDEQLNAIRQVLAAILILGNVRFTDDGKFAVIENIEEVHKVAKLLELDEKKFEWSLLNYCLVQSGTAEKRKHTNDEARDARDVLAAAIYCRLVDWIVNIINQKFAFGRAMYGDIHLISLVDMFGFECLTRNKTEQLLINSLNEQVQFLYNQRMFAWEMLEQEEEQIPGTAFHYYDNKQTVDHLMTKPYGLFSILDDATRGRLSYDYITDTINSKKNTHLQRVSKHEFSVAHYTGKITYDAREMADKNRDFVPPEMVETLRASNNKIVKILFTNQLTKTGNLTVAYEEQVNVKGQGNQKGKWGAALVAEKQKAKKLDTLSHGQYSQIHKMRTLASVFRSTSLEILKSLSVGGNSGNTHFVRCIRASLDYKPRSYQVDMVYQQIRALSVLDTTVARQKGFPQRVPFQEFLRRYKFLAFDFDENVEVSRDNCRLLLVRLKMEGWAIGKSKVFLKYYNVEFLSRLYEIQVKKIIKVQSMMRAFLAKRNIASKLKIFRQESIQKEAAQKQPSTDEAAVTIQKAFRGYKIRQKYGPLLNSKTGQIDNETFIFIKDYAKRWKEKTIFQVLLHYRAARYQDLVNLSQQIHLYNQAVVSGMKTNNKYLLLEKVDPKETNPALLGPLPPAVNKIPFRLDEIPFFDTAYMCDPLSCPPDVQEYVEDNESWDAPLRRTKNISSHIVESAQQCATDDTIPHSIQIAKESAEEPSCSQVADDSSTSYNRDLQSPHEDVPIRTPVYKKHPAPMPIDRNVDGNKPTEKSTTTEKPDLAARRQKCNPVKELENIGRVKNSVQDEDEPPFNFQAMLRKTNYQRASMKRSKSDGNNSIAGSTTSVKNVVFKSEDMNGVVKSKSTTRDFDFTDQETDIPIALPRSAVKSINTPVPSERRPSFGESTLIGGESFENIGTYVQEEIGPGIVLEGYAVDI